jgi:O-antigen ligase
MGFSLTILYLVTYYLTPVTIFGPLAAYRVELIIAVLALVVSLPAMSESFLGKTPQSLALIGLAFATFLSVVFGMHWPGGGLPAFLQFIPNAFAYLLVCLHCNSMKRLRILVFMMLSVCLFVIANGAFELQHVAPASDAALALNGDSPPPGAMDPSPYLLGMMNSAFQWFYRLRGQGEINDPNDFAQVVVCVLPLVFIFWKPGKTLRNTFFVLLPASVLLYGAYLTHSRGAIMALLAVVIVALRRRIGTVPSLLIAGVLFAAATALHVTGGRDISVNAGEDRTALWGEGLQLFKSHPFFGVGFGAMADHAGQTAHNSLVVCAAELGMFGLYFWALFLFPTVRDVLQLASPAKVSEAQPIVPEVAPFPYTMAARTIESIDKVEISSLGRLILLSLTGFLVAGWFLSRAFVVTLFLLGGIAEVVFEMALRRGMIAPRLRPARVMRNSGVLAIVLIIVMYITLRIVNLMH